MSHSVASVCCPRPRARFRERFRERFHARVDSRTFGWRRGHACAFVMCVVALCGPVAAPADASERPKIGLVLAGGGARGGAHIGVLKALEEAHVPIDYIAGTSIGAIMAALYAVGYSPDAMTKFVADIDWDEALGDRIQREDLSFRRKTDQELALFAPGLGYSRGGFRFRNGLILGQNIIQVLTRIGVSFPGETNFDLLGVPFRAVATDIATGEAVVLSGGDMGEALRASMAVPGVFAPVARDGRLLVDGGVANNLPIDVARAMGADIVIAVDISAPLLAQAEIQSPIDVTAQLTTVLTRRNVVAHIATLGSRDVLIVPKLQAFGSADFAHFAATIPAGYAATQAVQGQLAALALPPAQYAAWRAARRRAPDIAPLIAFYRIDNRSHIANSTLARELKLDSLVGTMLDPDLLRRHFAAVYGSDRFETIGYEPIREGDRYGLKVVAREKSWGPNYLKLRVLTQGDLGGDNGVSLGIDFDATDATKYSGEWRSYLQLGEERLIFTELYQPLGDDTGWFLLPRAQYQRRKQGLFNDAGDKLALFDVLERDVELRVGREFGAVARLETGLRVGAFEANRRIGVGYPRAVRRNVGEWLSAFTYDTLDSRNFPGAGMRLRLAHVGGRDWLNSGEPFDQISGTLDAATSVHATHVVGRALYTRTVRGTAPIHRQAALGGFFRLSGIESDQLNGQHAAFVGVALFQDFATPLISTYLGTTLEYGNVFQSDHIRRKDGLWSGSVWLGADTPLGPAYLGYGVLQGGTDTLFLTIGRPL